VAQGVPGRLKPRIFLTFRHYKGGTSSAKRTGRLYPMSNPWYSLSEAESTSGHMVLSGVPRKKSPLTPPGIDPGTSQLVVQCLNHYATSGPVWRYYSCICQEILQNTTNTWVCAAVRHVTIEPCFVPLGSRCVSLELLRQDKWNIWCVIPFDEIRARKSAMCKPVQRIRLHSPEHNET